MHRVRSCVIRNLHLIVEIIYSVPLPSPSSSRCKLETCLDLFIKEEILDGDEMPTCSKCKTRRKCTKSFTIQRFPKYLVIRTYTLNKIMPSMCCIVIYFNCIQSSTIHRPKAFLRNTLEQIVKYCGISNQ